MPKSKRKRHKPGPLAGIKSVGNEAPGKTKGRKTAITKPQASDPAGTQIRRGCLEDWPELERLKIAMGYPGSIFYDEASYLQRGLNFLRDCLTQPEELPDWRVLVLIENQCLSGYLLFVVDDEHGVTHQLQALIVDYAVFSFEGLSKLIARARKTVSAFENEYLLVELPPSQQRIQLWFYRCGFRAEQTRVAKRLQGGPPAVSSPEFRVRKAGPEDLTFILSVHAAYSASYRPAGRDTDLESIEFRFQLAYLALDFKNSLYFILEEKASGKPAGYLFLKEGPVYGTTKSFYVYDVAVAPGFSGRGLSVYLQGLAETIAGQQDALLYGDGSLATPVLSSWHAQMGYTVDTVRFALDCRPAC